MRQPKRRIRRRQTDSVVYGWLCCGTPYLNSRLVGLWFGKRSGIRRVDGEWEARPGADGSWLMVYQDLECLGEAEFCRLFDISPDDLPPGDTPERVALECDPIFNMAATGAWKRN